MSELLGSDANAPREVARRIETVGVAKVQMAALPLVMLGVLAGAFIALGAFAFLIVKANATLGCLAVAGRARLLAGAADGGGGWCRAVCGQQPARHGVGGRP